MGIAAGDVESFVDTGSYIFNALVSGSFMEVFLPIRSLPWQERAALERLSFVFLVRKHFLDSDPDAGVIYFETESAISKQMIESRGIDSKSHDHFPSQHHRRVPNSSIRIVDKFMEQKEDRKPLMFVLDSLGMLATNKEVEDATNDKNVRDMTKAQLIKSVFRILTLKTWQG